MSLLGGPNLGGPNLGSMNAALAPVTLDAQGVVGTLVLAAALTIEKEKTSEGSVIEVVRLPWLALFQAIEKNPALIYQFATHPRKFEEFIAGAYLQDGWDDVILTPRSGDHGRDVIAIKKGFGSVRFLEQTKAYSEGRLVTNDDARAMLGVTLTDQNCSKVLITTTSDFQPSILTGNEFSHLMPHRLELKNGEQLRTWLREIAKPKEP